MKINCFANQEFMEPHCSEMQNFLVKLLGTHVAILDQISTICTKYFQDGKKTDILGHCLYNHQMVPSILESTYAASGCSVQSLRKQQEMSSLLCGHPPLTPIQRRHISSLISKPSNLYVVQLTCFSCI